MIEVRIDKETLAKTLHEVTASIELMVAMRKAGMPLIGALVVRGVEHGRMEWYVEEDIDGDTCVWRWYDTGETADNVPTRKSSGGTHGEYTWACYGSNGRADDDEL